MKKDQVVGPTERKRVWLFRRQATSFASNYCRVVLLYKKLILAGNSYHEDPAKCYVVVSAQGQWIRPRYERAEACMHSVLAGVARSSRVLIQPLPS